MALSWIRNLAGTRRPGSGGEQGVKRSTLAAFISQLATRRAALRSSGVSGVGAALTALALAAPEGQAKKHKRRRKRKKTCQPPKGKCGKKCKPLNTATNCGRCGNTCAAGTTCQDGVCCATPLCRGECRDACPPPNPRVRFPQDTNYPKFSGAIFPANRSNAHVTAAYEKWKSRYLVKAARDEDGRQVFRVALGKPGTDNHKVTVSEGQGYGMVIVATMAGYDEEAQEIFDGLWRFRLAHPSTIDERLMDWRVPGGEGDDSAFDGDADIAYGLLLAHAQWGSNDPTHFDYLAEAKTVIAGILDSTIGPQSKLPMLGDWVNPNGGTYNQDTPRSSDFMPGHFRAFGNATVDDVWDDVVTACQQVVTTLQTNFSAGTGLLPDFVVDGSKPAPPGFLEDPHDGDYNYNAGRDPWRLGTDALLNGDATSAMQAGKITAWAAGKTGGNPHNLRAGYTLSGGTWGGTDYFTTFFAAPLGVAAMTQAGLQAWLDAIYDAVANVSEDYYEDTVTLLCLLVMTGNFWDPTLV